MHRQQGGFTIVESMIVLAVTGVIFAAAAASISGRQANEQFYQSLRDFESKITDIANDVSTGYYAFDDSKRCNIVSDRPHLDSSASERGYNQDCIFLGNTLVFDETGITSYGVLGRRLVSGSRVESLNDAHPTMFEELSSRYDLSWGTEITKVTTPNAGSADFKKFFSIFTCMESDAACGGVAANSRGGTVRVVDYDTNYSNLNDVSSCIESGIDGADCTGSIIDSNSPIVVCVRGGNGMTATISLTNKGGSIAAKSDVGATCPE